MRSQVPSILDVQPALSSFERYAKLASVVIFGLILCAALVGITNNGVFLRHMRALAEGLPSIATVKDNGGSATRKTVLDSLWIPIGAHSIIYEADMIATGSGETLDVQMGSEITISILPNTIIRIRTSDGKPLIRVSQGSLNVHALSDQKILIQRGAKIEEVAIKKGSYIIKSDAALGVQVTAFNQEVKVAAANNSEEKKADPKAQAEEDEEESSDNGEEDRGTAGTPARQVFDLPSPKEKTMFLIRSPREILVASRLSCPDLCNLKIMRNGHEWRTVNSKLNESAIYRIPPKDVLEGDYEWLFSSETYEYRGHFSVRPYGDKDLEKAIENQLPIEIL